MEGKEGTDIVDIVEFEKMREEIGEVAERIVETLIVDNKFVEIVRDETGVKSNDT